MTILRFGGRGRAYSRRAMRPGASQISLPKPLTSFY
jgi:hypothetical protein